MASLQDLFLVEKTMTGVTLALTLAKLAIVGALIVVVWKYWTKNRLALLLIGLIAMYFFFS